MESPKDFPRPAIRPPRYITIQPLRRSESERRGHKDQWFSRYVIAWQMSDTLEFDFCARALDDALFTDIPVIHNSDQGVQYTSEEYTAVLEDRDIRISMDARGRRFDNIFTERLRRTVKYEKTCTCIPTPTLTRRRKDCQTTSRSTITAGSTWPLDTAPLNSFT